MVVYFQVLGKFGLVWECDEKMSEVLLSCYCLAGICAFGVFWVLDYVRVQPSIYLLCTYWKRR